MLPIVGFRAVEPSSEQATTGNSTALKAAKRKRRQCHWKEILGHYRERDRQRRHLPRSGCWRTVSRRLHDVGLSQIQRHVRDHTHPRHRRFLSRLRIPCGGFTRRYDGTLGKELLA